MLGGTKLCQRDSTRRERKNEYWLSSPMVGEKLMVSSSLQSSDIYNDEESLSIHEPMRLNQKRAQRQHKTGGQQLEA